jgi:hypothetical protein
MLNIAESRSQFIQVIGPTREYEWRGTFKETASRTSVRIC